MALDTKTIGLSFFTCDRAEATVEVCGIEFPVAYRRKLLTPAFIDRMGNEPVWGLVLELLLEWSLVDDTGDGKPKPVPVTEEAIKKLPLDFLTELLWAMVQAPRPNPTRDQPA